MEDQKLKAFMDNFNPKHMDTQVIKQKTYQKIHEHERRRKHHRVFSVAAVAIGFLLVVGVGVGYLAYPQDEREGIAQKEERQVPVREQRVKVPQGERMTIMLADGTKVVANSRTTVTYPESFPAASREIYVKGEAYLEVAHDAKRPFIVKTDHFKVKVLGTRFNVSDYDASMSNVVLVEGSVELTTANKDVVRMQPSDKVEIQNGAFTSKKQVNTDDYTCWMNGIMNLHGDDIQAIARKLSHYYGVRIVCEQIPTKPLYGKLVLQDSLSDVLNAIDIMTGVKTVKRGGTLYLVRSR